MLKNYASRPKMCFPTKLQNTFPVGSWLQLLLITSLLPKDKTEAGKTYEEHLSAAKS